jgi:hypothetical protein
VTVAVESAREEWAEAHRALQEMRGDRRRYERLMEQVEAITGELRRRVGQTFTLGQLASAYEDADRWSRGAVADSGAPPDWPRTLAMVEAVAFHLYARGAVDYTP